MWLSWLQAQTTDDPPVFILGGNIVPIGANGTNNTDAARAANLTLLAALPGLQSPFFHRCGQGCAAQSSPSSLVACGHIYLDQGAVHYFLKVSEKRFLMRSSMRGSQ